MVLKHVHRFHQSFCFYKSIWHRLKKNDMSSHMKFLWKNKILLECRTLLTVFLFFILNQYLFLNEGILSLLGK